jgi:hypothetical protein
MRLNTRTALIAIVAAAPIAAAAAFLSNASAYGAGCT